MNPISAARRTLDLSVEELAARTRISLRYVEAIDEGRLSDLPPGIYGRAYVRAVAAQVGVHGEALEAILAPLAPAPDPLPILEEVHAPRRSAFNVRLPTDSREHVAALIDAAVLLAISFGVVTIVAAACGIRAGALVSMTPVPLIVLCAAIWTTYFVLLGGVLGCTAGQFACGLALRDSKPLRLGAILHRTLGVVHGEPGATTGAAAPAGLRHSTADPASPA